MNIKKLLGKRIKELRKQRKMTQEQVAEIMNIETTSLSNIENGKYYPTAENLEKIMQILHADPRALFCFEHCQEPEDLITEIGEILKRNPDRIRDVYKIVKSLAVE